MTWRALALFKFRRLRRQASRPWSSHCCRSNIQNHHRRSRRSPVGLGGVCGPMTKFTRRHSHKTGPLLHFPDPGGGEVTHSFHGVKRSTASAIGNTALTSRNIGDHDLAGAEYSVSTAVRKGGGGQSMGTRKAPISALGQISHALCHSTSPCAFARENIQRNIW